MPYVKPLPLSLYIHIPWCVRKCPYCDFNSHESKHPIPEDLYVAALLDEFKMQQSLIEARPITSIFFGGGTPSLFSSSAIEKILDGIAKNHPLDCAIEITLEANPGTAEQARFSGFRKAGINRLSLGIQSLQDEKLKQLGRIHDTQNALRSIEMAKTAGFDNFNLDLMYGLPNQTIDDAIHDLELALRFEPPHLSWYQLTIEPNTYFYHHTPVLPPDDTLWDMQLAGQTLLKENGLFQYEVSAYARNHKACRHNLNYWEFGDYLGIGAGAHSKITSPEGKVNRFSQVKNPRDYLMVEKRRIQNSKYLLNEDLILEFMLNGLRLTEGIRIDYFTERTGIDLQIIEPMIKAAVARGLLKISSSHFCPTELGGKFLNDLVEMFMDSLGSKN